MSAAGISAIDIPGYRILGALGQGGMASVYLAVQENFGREVALKLVSARYRDDASFAARFMREAKIVAQMRHSNIVSVYDVGNHQGQLFLSMELLDRDLKSRIGTGLSEIEAARICIAIASALSYAHEKGFLHRDIKPENVLFRSDGTPVLTDFGIARALESTESMTQTGMLVGTPSYMSPEQARGESVDQRTDIYALGVLFYELLTGGVPYKATSAVSTALKHISDPIPVLPEPLKHWNPFLRTILAKNANERFQTCKDVIGSLALIANITEIEDSQRTAIINAAEMAALIGKKSDQQAAPKAKDKVLSQQTKIGPQRKRTSPVLPVLFVVLIAGAFALHRFGVVDVPFLSTGISQLETAFSSTAAVPQTLAVTQAPAVVQSGAVERNSASSAAESAGDTTATTSVPSTPVPSDATATDTNPPLPEPATPAPVTSAPENHDVVTNAVEPSPLPNVIEQKASVPKTAELEPIPRRASKPVYVEEKTSVPIFIPIENIAPKQLARFKQAFESRDITALRAVAVISPANQQLVQTLFAHYNSIRLQLAGVVSVPATNEMQARFVIEELRNSQGQVVEPGERWKTLPVVARVNAFGTVLLFW